MGKKNYDRSISLSNLSSIIYFYFYLQKENPHTFITLLFLAVLDLDYYNVKKIIVVKVVKF